MKHFPILQGRAYVVELPEGAKFPRTETNQAVIPYGQDLTWDINGGEKSYGMDETEWLSLPQGNWRIIGMLIEVTEKTLSTVLDSTELNEGRRLYNIHGEPFPNRLTDSALESLESAILAEGYTFQSTTKPENKDFYWGYLDDLAKWEAAQSRVLSHERCLLLRRVD